MAQPRVVGAGNMVGGNGLALCKFDGRDGPLPIVGSGSRWKIRCWTTSQSHCGPVTPRYLTYRVSVKCRTFRTLLVALNRRDANTPGIGQGYRRSDLPRETTQCCWRLANVKSTPLAPALASLYLPRAICRGA